MYEEILKAKKLHAEQEKDLYRKMLHSKCGNTGDALTKEKIVEDILDNLPPEEEEEAEDSVQASESVGIAVESDGRDNVSIQEAKISGDSSDPEKKTNKK